MWPVMAKTLTLKQQKFLELRLEKGLKGAEAYRQAYGSKMPRPLCAKQAYRLLHNPKIKAYLDAPTRWPTAGHALNMPA